MSQKSWEARVTAIAFEASDSLRRLAGYRSDDPVKTRIATAARAAGLSYWRAFDIWYRKAKAIRAEELDAIRAAAAQRSRGGTDDFAAIAQDFEALAGRIARLASSQDRDMADRARLLAERVRRLAPGE